jgi:predicted metal-dependent phosphotriesterase family hydrolase
MPIAEIVVAAITAVSVPGRDRIEVRRGTGTIIQTTSTIWGRNVATLSIVDDVTGETVMVPTGMVTSLEAATRPIPTMAEVIAEATANVKPTVTLEWVSTTTVDPSDARRSIFSAWPASAGAVEISDVVVRQVQQIWDTNPGAHGGTPQITAARIVLPFMIDSAAVTTVRVVTVLNVPGALVKII